MESRLCQGIHRSSRTSRGKSILDALGRCTVGSTGDRILRPPASPSYGYSGRSVPERLVDSLPPWPNLSYIHCTAWIAVMYCTRSAGCALQLRALCLLARLTILIAVSALLVCGRYALGFYIVTRFSRYSSYLSVFGRSKLLPAELHKEMELHKEDAEGWLYRGEGAANIVLAYHGHRPSFIGRVLRIRKAPKNDKNDNLEEKKDSKPVLSVDERKLWREWPSMATATTSAALAHVYAADIMQPLLGKDHVDAGLLVFLTTGFLEAVNEDVVAKQPEWRSKDAMMDMTAGVALLIADHSSFHTLPGEVKDLPQTITVELKPKWGCLPEAATISEENNVKLHVSRFTLFQQLKLQQGKIKSVSKYSPLDLFSGNDEGIYKALVALFETPQNNIRIFLGGEEIFGGPADGGSTDKAIISLEEKLAGVSVAPEGERVPLFQRLVASALNKSKALDQLLNVQKLDAYDIEGAILAYKKFMEITDDADADAVATTLSRDDTRVENLALEVEGEHKKRDKAWITSLSWEESRRVVRNFLISGTAKDCGLMITLRPLHNSYGTPFPAPSASIATCPTTGQQYICKIAFLDLDTKRLKKMPFYHSIDQEIVDTYKACVH